MSCLDAVVASINALCAMVNQCYVAFKLMHGLNIQDMLICKRYRKGDNILCVMAFIRSKSDLLAVSYSKKYFSFVVNASEN